MIINLIINFVVGTASIGLLILAVALLVALLKNISPHALWYRFVIVESVMLTLAGLGVWFLVRRGNREWLRREFSQDPYWKGYRAARRREPEERGAGLGMGNVLLRVLRFIGYGITPFAALAIIGLLIGVTGGSVESARDMVLTVVVLTGYWIWLVVVVCGRPFRQVFLALAPIYGLYFAFKILWEAAGKKSNDHHSQRPEQKENGS